jgi:hypothetical protein
MAKNPYENDAALEFCVGLAGSGLRMFSKEELIERNSKLNYSFPLCTFLFPLQIPELAEGSSFDL